MKRGFLNNPKGKRNEGLLGDPRSNRQQQQHPFRIDASERLGTASGIPETTTSTTSSTTDSMPGLSWVPVTDELRQRWTAPWQAVVKEEDMMEDDNDEDDTIATAPSTQPSYSPSSTCTTATPTVPPLFDLPVRGQPFLPHKTMDAPKSALLQWYSKELQRNVLTNESYFVWHNDGMAHERRFTSIFVCPITAEVFCTGTYGPKKYYTLTSDPVTGVTVVWFNDKASAQHGAASRAYDCFSLRKYTPLGMRSVRLGGDEQEPYMREQDAPNLPSMPDDIKNKMQAQRRLIATRRTQSASIISPVAPKQVLGTWYNKAPRSHQLTNTNYLTWRDDAMPHLVKYTSVFLCPLTGEVFASGRHGNPDSFEERTDSTGERTVYWYNKKIMAEHAAAARAYDCWCLRLEGRKSDFLGQDTPYMRQADAPPLPVLPSDVAETLIRLQKQTKNPLIMQPPPPMPTDEETLEDRAKYRSARQMQPD